VHLAFPEARQALPPRAAHKALLSGNPIRTVKRLDPREARVRFGLDPESRVVLVTGGSQGARALNQAVLDAVQGVESGELERPEELSLLWATGPMNFEEVAAGLRSMGDPGWVRAVGYIENMPEALDTAALAISRAGAMTTSELLAWGVPAILVPLPTSAADHQRRNAESLARAGSALHLPEKELTGRALWEALTSLLTRPERLPEMRRAALARGRPEATREIAEALETLLPRPLPGSLVSGKEVHA
jgi:UDP-N-acetylglucosamine--N-acetylmuramyl-(pentapeptide) pyrophosphoryl-undecaprenol N-acetylglucosamine transferase